MKLESILAELDIEIARLQQARALLTDVPVKRGPGRPPIDRTVVKKKRNLSPEGRARIAEAVKRRWTKAKKAAK
jgi:hypothetical protein